MEMPVMTFLASCLMLGLTRAYPGSESGSPDLPPVVPTEGQCECAAFESVAAASAQPPAAPLVTQAPGLRVPCDELGAASCRQLCLALAKAAGARGPELLCDAVPHADSLKVALYTRTCDRDGDWHYTGVTARDPICCHDNKPLLCPGQTSYPSDPEGCDTESVPSNCDEE